MFPTILFSIIIFLYGITIGSFLNVCICRLPKKENIVTIRSHCTSCGYQLKWYDLIPLFSWLALGGRCRKCKSKISVQYPIIEALNGVLWLTIFFVCGISIETALYCVMASALLALSVIDFRTYEIPFGFNLMIAALGLIRVLTDLSNWTEYVIGFFAVSAPLYLLYIITKGRGIGGGDIKLMAAAGLYLGFASCVVAFLFGCVYACVVHTVRMRFFNAGRIFALGPYLAAGIVTAIWFGEDITKWYKIRFLVV